MCFHKHWGLPCPQALKLTLGWALRLPSPDDWPSRLGNPEPSPGVRLTPRRKLCGLEQNPLSRRNWHAPLRVALALPSPLDTNPRADKLLDAYPQPSLPVSLPQRWQNRLAMPLGPNPNAKFIFRHPFPRPGPQALQRVDPWTSLLYSACHPGGHCATLSCAKPSEWEIPACLSWSHPNLQRPTGLTLKLDALPQICPQKAPLQEGPQESHVCQPVFLGCCDTHLARKHSRPWAPAWPNRRPTWANSHNLSA